jgi:tetratricopeptide (TPR) repeat protein
MPRIALSMIVRNAAETLGACLESVRGVVDEIVIADTGSTDATLKIAGESGARVIEIPWNNDFAEARNLALGEVRGEAHADWVLVLDADEVLDPGAKSAIPNLMAAKDVAGYQVPIRNYFLSLEDRIWDQPAKPNDSSLPAAKAFPAYVEHENVRLFRRDQQIYFVGRVHESVGSRIEGNGLRLGHASFLIHHFGLAGDAETRARKNRFYRDLGKLKVADMPGNAQAHLELGLAELENLGNVEDALACFENACRLNPRLGVAWFFAGVAHFRLEKYRESSKCLKQAEKRGRRTVAAAEMIGDCHYNLGEFAAAASAYERALRVDSDSATLGSKFGLASVRSGSAEVGLQRIRHAILQQPHIAGTHDRLILSLVWLGRTSEGALAAEEKLRGVKTPGVADFARAASLWAKVGNWAQATAVLHVGLRIHRDDESLKKALNKLETDAGPEVGELAATLNNGE